MDKEFKKYLDSEAKQSWPSRQKRIWQTVFNNIKNPTEEVKNTRVLSVWELGTMPMALALVFVVGGAAIVDSASWNMPGNRVYQLKLSLENVQDKMMPLAMLEEDFSVQVIERRTKEIEQLLAAKNTDRRISATQRERTRQRIEQAEEEVGVAVLALLEKEKREQQVSQSQILSEQLSDSQEETTERQNKAISRASNVVETASAREIGKIVVSGLLSDTNLDSQTRAQKLRELLKELAGNKEGVESELEDLEQEVKGVQSEKDLTEQESQPKGVESDEDEEVKTEITP